MSFIFYDRENVLLGHCYYYYYYYYYYLTSFFGKVVTLTNKFYTKYKIT